MAAVSAHSLGASPSNQSATNGIYFKGFSSNTEKDVILSIFGKYGVLKSYHFGTNKNGVFLGYGSIEYENDEIAEKAIKATSGMIVCGKCITVEKFVRKEKREEAKEFNNIYVKNFIDDIRNEDELSTLFSRFGGIQSVKVEKDESGRSKGFGYVCFANPENARIAVESLNNYVFPSGKVLFVSKHQSKSERFYKRREPFSNQTASWQSSLRPIIPPVFQQTANFSTYKRGHRRYTSESESENFRSVYIKNFGDTIQNEMQLCSLFQRFGAISSAKVMTDARNRPLGYGFVNFYNAQNARRAVHAVNGLKYRGNVLFVGKAMKKIERQQELRTTFLTQFSGKRNFRCPSMKRNLSVTSVLNTECNICFLEVKASDCILLACKHVICKECIVLYIQHLVKNKEIESILCPANECESELTFDLIGQLIPQELHEQYDKCLLDNYLDKCEDIIWCPKAECRCPVYLTSDTPTLGTCPKCEYLFCTNCGEGYHGIYPCTEFESEAQRFEIIDRYMNGNEEEKSNLERRYTRKKLEKEVEEHLSNLCIKEECKQCPSCKVNIHKYEGCNKMICVKCKVFFCWLCFEILDKMNAYRHFEISNCKLFAVPDNLV